MTERERRDAASLRQMLLTHYDGVHEGDFDKALSVFTEDVERTRRAVTSFVGSTSTSTVSR